MEGSPPNSSDDLRDRSGSLGGTCWLDAVSHRQALGQDNVVTWRILVQKTTSVPIPSCAGASNCRTTGPRMRSMWKPGQPLAAILVQFQTAIHSKTRYQEPSRSFRTSRRTSLSHGATVNPIFWHRIVPNVNRSFVAKTASAAVP